MKKYLVLPENNTATHLEIDFYYHLGGYNVFTHKDEKRGYYISVSPVTRERGFVSYTAFTGVKQLVKAVSRKSAKAEKEAEKEAVTMENDLIIFVCNKNGIPFPEV